MASGRFSWWTVLEGVAIILIAAVGIGVYSLNGKVKGNTKDIQHNRELFGKDIDYMKKSLDRIEAAIRERDK